MASIARSIAARAFTRPPARHPVPTLLLTSRGMLRRGDVEHPPVLAAVLSGDLGSHEMKGTKKVRSPPRPRRNFLCTLRCSD